MQFFPERPMSGSEWLLYDLALGYLSVAESMYGPVAPGVSLAAVYFAVKPGIIYMRDSSSVGITLSPDASQNEARLVYQLSHEVCHVLHPGYDFSTGIKDETLVINEGLSMHFSFEMSAAFMEREILMEATRNQYPNYFEAYLIVTELLSYGPGIIKKLRELQPRINRLTPDCFMNVNRSIPQDLIGSALSKFRYK